VNSYEFTAKYKTRNRHLLVIQGRIGGTISGNPDLQRVDTAIPGELLLMLVFREAIQHNSSGLCWTIPVDDLPKPLLQIRILLTDFQEFIIVSHSENRAPHPIAKGCTHYRTAES